MICKVCGCKLNIWTAEINNKFEGWYCSDCNPYKPKNYIMKIITKGSNCFSKKEIIFISLSLIFILLGIGLLINGFGLATLYTVGITYMSIGIVLLILMSILCLFYK